jgi:radical SAM-linked protein
MFVHHTNLEDANADHRKLVCYDCGVACDLTQMREERLVFLDRLGAKARKLREETSAPADTSAPPAKVEPRNRRAPTVNFTQGEARRVRLSFERLGRAAFHSHLDLVRVVPRVFRRAEVELYYSQGFHPKPDMVFGPALALGIATLDEYVDVKVAEDVDPQTLCEALQLGTPEGVRFTGAVLLGPNDPGLNKLIENTEYVAAVPWTVLRERGIVDMDALRAKVDAARAEGLSAMRPVEKGLARKIDVGAYVLDVAAGEGDEAIACAGYAGSLACVRFVTRVTPDGTCKPSEVIRALLGDGIEARYVRTHMGKRDEHGQWAGLMELERFRREPRTKRPRVESAGEEGAVVTDVVEGLDPAELSSALSTELSAPPAAE